ncbi:conjugal transfer protein TraF [Thalassolituus maritimus]|uniref:Plasmid transfer operon, TraF, protein n=1 Tax=Thalassolituus maritimus TaxID=484498 RepID=A0ABQ0A1G5_9GAMM
MLNRSLLGSAIVLASSYAVATPYMPMDARGLAMGNTGVASAKLAHAPAYNPSLLSQAESNDNFALIFPQIGVNLADEASLEDEASRLDDDIIPRIEAAFEERGTNDPVNFNKAVANMTEAAEQLGIQIESMDDVDGRTNAQKANDLRVDNQAFGDSIAATNTELQEVNSATDDMIDSLRTISGDPLRGRLGIGGAVAIPGKKLAAAVSFKADVNASARILFSGNDANLLGAYVPAASGYLDASNGITDSVDDLADEVEAGTATPADLSATKASVDEVNTYTSDPVDTAAGSISIFENGEISNAASDPTFDSQYQVVAIGIAEVGLSLSREFYIADKAVAIGITPKLQQVATYHYVGQVNEEDNAPDIELEDSERTSNHINLDIGTSFYVDPKERLRVGIVIQDLISKDFEYADVPVDGDADGEVAEGGKVSLKPKLRAGVAYTRDWYNLAADLDLVENEALAFEDPTQYLSVGGEVDLAGWAQLRAGLRTNLAGDSNVVSIGAGVSPFGVHFDLAAMMDISDPEKELGLALETGFYF